MRRSESSSDGFTQPWERRLHAALRELPEIPAPAGLVPAVMDVIRARESLRARPWYRRPALLWPPALRIGFAVLALAGLGALGWGIAWGAGHVATLSPPAAWTQTLNQLAALKSAGTGLFEALQAAVASSLTPVRLAVLGAIAGAQLLLLVLGGAFWRAALQPQPR